MGLNTFTTALSGLASNTQGLNVVGNNLANMNTVGFKTQTVSFTDILGQTVSGSSAASSANVGLGSKVGQVSSVFTQGGFETTNRETDVAIQGKGFFVVNNGDGNFYTRAGNFSIDADGNLVDPNGFGVQGYARDPNTGLIDTSGLLSDVRIPASTGFSNPTGAIELALNLDAAAPVGDVFSTSIQVYD
jgi:flagellar hook protein FlgE